MQQQYDELVVPATAAGLDAAVPLLTEAVAAMELLTSLVADAHRALRNDLSGVPRRDFAALFGLDYQLPQFADGLRAIAAAMREARDQTTGQ